MKNFLKVLCLVTLAFNVCYGAVYRTGVAEGSVTYSGGGSGGSGTNYVYIYTNGMPGSEVTNVVAAFTTNKIDNLNGKGTNLWTTNFAMHGTVGATNVTFKFHEPQTNQNINTWYSLGDNGGVTRSWQQVVGTNRWYVQNGSGVAAIPFQLHGNGLGNVTLGHNSGSTTTNAGDLRVAGNIYLPVPSGTATNLTLDPNGKIVAVTNAPGGGSGSQTPWTQDIDANYFSVSNIVNVVGSGLLQGRYARLYPTNGLLGLTISPSTGAGTLVQVTDTNTAAALYVTPNGNVGIKTNAPAAALEVQGSVVVSGGITNSGRLRIGTGGDIVISENGATMSGDRGILLFDAGTPIVAVAGRVNFAATGTDAGSADTTIYRSASGILGLGTTLSTPAGSLVLSNLTTVGITIYKSNSITAAAVAAAITNGDFGSIVISNGLHHFWMSNNVMGWKLAAP